ncbi:MAG: 4Fe-4S dicluster domain-containing protein, partial [Anaerolineales bacterium]|nr:4Fe-4S dicluster domain-containing protein [Anaerolineales bacterium]
GHLIESEAMRWLISCAGCGMCEQACPQHLPLSIIFNHIQSQLADEFTYNAGMSFEHPIPVIRVGSL